jgi:hypothetical protein
MNVVLPRHPSSSVTTRKALLVFLVLITSCRGYLPPDSKFLLIVCRARMVSTRDNWIILVWASEE